MLPPLSIKYYNNMLTSKGTSEVFQWIPNILVFSDSSGGVSSSLFNTSWTYPLSKKSLNILLY